MQTLFKHTENCDAGMALITKIQQVASGIIFLKERPEDDLMAAVTRSQYN